jgi:adenine phosphoribosyltransferase
LSGTDADLGGSVAPGTGPGTPADGAPDATPSAGPVTPAGSGAFDVAALLGRLIRDVPDYPQPGVIFKDITPLLADAEGFAATVAALASGQDGIDKVAGIEARGFILAAPVAYRLGVGFAPVRKLGKLPGPTIAETYDLEYGTATVEVHVDAFAPGERVLMIDDVLATGGTAAATAELIRRSGAEVVSLGVLIEIGFLGGRARLPGLDIRSLLSL